MRRIVPIILLFFAATSLFGIEVTIRGHRYETAGVVRDVIEEDRNGDGSVDYRLFLDPRGRRIMEQLDFNYDGKLDDFYFYHEDVLKMREIDSNFDEQIDIWVYILEGVYIGRIEQDCDFDGKVDKVLDYSKR